ncbi:cytochrome c oxidase subunit 4 [Streptomyces sp. PTM05]|uniref:cytochrome-c oxidase n=1 Tax=Streptantibioticus parmotrematis TaxID=2873249 RepID=A0ABS7QJU8_9ACTN|nr:cytochrome c oxidase subunit 4 [Streptantibioticus parmotrematis]MBY8883448.1 cytochrome c oxidase subunit 4 [Streptantibioticus parmotrematis]
MRTEARLFAGVALFFLAAFVVYAVYATDPAGKAALAVSFLMASLISFFLYTQYRRKGTRPEDRGDAEILERSGPVDFFPARSAWPPMTALGSVLCALGVVYGLWLFLIGFGVLGAGVGGFAFQYAHRGE